MDQLSFDQYKEVIREYIEEYCVEKGVRPSTLQQKRNFHKRLTVFLNGKPFNLETAKAFQQFLSLTCKEPASKARMSTELRAFINWCYKYKDLFVKNWAFKIVKPNVPRKKWKLLSEEMALKVINEGCTPNSFDNSRIIEAKEEHRLALLFMLLHGLRIGEVMKLKSSDLRLEAEIPFVILRETKNGDERWEPIHSYFIPILKERKKYDRVFYITKKTARLLLKRGAKKLGLKGYDITPHRLRDIYALSRLRKQPPMLVSRSLGHKDFKTTDLHYSHYDLSDLAPVVEDSNVLQSQISPSEFRRKAEKALKVAGLVRPNQYQLNISESNGKVTIEAVFPKQEDNTDK